MNKYRNKPVSYDGMRFDSTAERNRWMELCLLQRAGQITDLQRQVRFPIIPKSEHGQAIVYVADFTYYENGKLIIEDVKGVRTAVYKLKNRLMAECGYKITEVRA